jgi:hypothetical protein
MALFGVTPDVMKPTALLLNLFVSSSSFLQYYRGNYFKWSIFWPLAFASIPMAFVGGLLHIDASIYKQILGVLILIPVVRFLFFDNISVDKLRPAHTAASLLIGAFIGTLSGMIGIGGGILLSPILLLLCWTDQKQTAAISALFIFVNSIAGLAGQLMKGVSFSPDMLLYVLTAFSGGLLGAYFGALKFNQAILKYILAIVLAMAAYKLLLTAA